jgi:putative ABC transport system permease protein
MHIIPGVETAAYATTFPLGHPDARRLYIREQVGREAPHIDTYFVSGEYFRAMRIPLLRGRSLNIGDRRGRTPVAVISESCARTQFPGQDPIGQHIQVDKRDDRKPWPEIVGITGDVRQYGLDEAPDSAVYLPFPQMEEPRGWGSLIVRATLSPTQIEAEVRRAMQEVDPALPIFHLQPMNAYIAKSLAQRTFTLTLTATLGALALVLAIVGIYGVISYTVATRTREVGIRTALGAKASDVVFLILNETFKKVLLGLTVGLCISLACSRLLASLLFAVKPNDVATIASVALLICVVALLASYLPAHRAAQLDPNKALRTT